MTLSIGAVAQDDTETNDKAIFCFSTTSKDTLFINNDDGVGKIIAEVWKIDKKSIPNTETPVILLVDDRKFKYLLATKNNILIPNSTSN